MCGCVPVRKYEELESRNEVLMSEIDTLVNIVNSTDGMEEELVYLSDELSFSKSQLASRDEELVYLNSLVESLTNQLDQMIAPGDGYGESSHEIPEEYYDVLETKK